MNRGAALLCLLLLCCDAGSQPEDSRRSLQLEPTPSNVSHERSVLVHMFNWPFKDVTAELPRLRDAGFSHVLVSPPQLSNGQPWWGRYQPLDYRILYGPLGTEADFRAMNRVADELGLKIVVDVVLNHMANLGLAPEHLYYPPENIPDTPADLLARHDIRPGSLFQPEHFHSAGCIRNWGNHAEVVRLRLCGPSPDAGLPDLRTGTLSGGHGPATENWHPEVLAAHREYLKRLMAMGADGFRFDAVKHMPPAYFRALYADLIPSDFWTYGEVIATSPADYERDLEPYLRTGLMDFMDFPLAATLRDAFQYGGSLTALRDPEQRRRALAGSIAVTFVTNHDVWGNADGLGLRYSDHTDEMLAHAFILGREAGIPYIYSQRQAERDVTPNEYVRFHRNDRLRSMIEFHNRMLGTDFGWLKVDDTLLIFRRGTRGLVLINKSAHQLSGEVDAQGLSEGDYIAMDNAKQRMSIHNGRLRYTIPPRSYAMLIHALR
ncbi:MAG: hypothetical protein KDK30_11605 [Leptospiraceae bacterium]|nr:hypothetical protein [Leptospiraceae bacterium]